MYHLTIVVSVFNVEEEIITNFIRVVELPCYRFSNVHLHRAIDYTKQLEISIILTSAVCLFSASVEFAIEF